MPRKGNCLDNSPMENFFGLMKQEMYYGEALCSYEELIKRIEEYIHFIRDLFLLRISVDTAYIFQCESDQTMFRQLKIRFQNFPFQSL